jgi:Protein of unknown function (DUF4232)
MSTLRTRLGSLLAAGVLAAGATVGFAATAASAGAAVPACSGAQLSLIHTPTDSGAGHGAFVLIYRNVGATCTLRGYPGLDAQDSIHRVMAHATRTLNGYAGGAHAINTITLPPGGYASATAEWMNFNPKTSGACPFSTYVAVTAPNTFKTVRAVVSLSVCSLQIHPVVAGATGFTGFANAQIQWVRGTAATSANHGAYWHSAALDLATQGVEFTSEIALLHQLIALPAANQTPAQNATYHADIAALNRFFGTPGIYA